jgi:hypothetical protein
MAHRLIPLTPPLFFHFTLPVILRLTRLALRKMKSTGGDQSSNLREPSLILYHCATHTLTIVPIIKTNINIFCHFSEAA